MWNKCVIYDFETMSTDTFTGAVVSLAVLKYDESRFLNQPYKFQELIDDARYIKFDVAEQVRKYNRKIDPETLKWWDKQSPEAKAMLKPSKNDISIDSLYNILYNDMKIQECKYQYSRGDTFDGGFLKSILRENGQDCPHNLYNSRDIRSLIAGMTWGTDINPGFFPENVNKADFVHHNPIHDIALDVMRLQYLTQTLMADDDIPF